MTGTSRFTTSVFWHSPLTTAFNPGRAARIGRRPKVRLNGRFPILRKLGMHLTQVTPTGSMVAEWKITRGLSKSSKPDSRPKKAVASTSFDCGGRRGFGVHVADVARRGRGCTKCVVRWLDAVAKRW